MAIANGTEVVAFAGRVVILPTALSTGKERDVAETGYDYFGARYYDSWNGRWLSVEPMGELHPDYSPYAYVYNNPIVFIDPFGLDTMWTHREDGSLWGSHWIPDNISTPWNQGGIVNYYDNQYAALQAEMNGISDWWSGVQEGADAYVRERMNGRSNGWNTAGNVRRTASTSNAIVKDLTMASPAAAGITKVIGWGLSGAAVTLPLARMILDGENYKLSEFGVDESSAVAAFGIGVRLGASSGALTGVGLWYAKMFGNYYSDLFSGDIASGRGR